MRLNCLVLVNSLKPVVIHTKTDIPGYALKHGIQAQLAPGTNIPLETNQSNIMKLNWDLRKGHNFPVLFGSIHKNAPVQHCF
jgi:hypothetical protein